MFKTFLSTLFCASTLLLSAQAKPVNEVSYDAFLKDLQKSHSDQGQAKLVFWLPNITWQVLASQRSEITPEMAGEIEKLLGDYVIICATSTDLSGAKVANQSASSTAKNLSLIVNGKTYKCLDKDEINEFALAFKEGFEPALEGMMGNLGKGMRLYFFDLSAQDTDDLLDPYGNQKFSVKLYDHTFDYQLPIPSLMQDKTCSTDGESFPHNYNYCPIHGNKLGEMEVVDSPPPMTEESAFFTSSGTRKMMSEPDMSKVKVSSDTRVALDLTINDNGEVTDCSVNRRLTSTKDEAIIKQVVDLVRQQVKYNANSNKKQEAVSLIINITAN